MSEKKVRLIHSWPILKDAPLSRNLFSTNIKMILLRCPQPRVSGTSYYDEHQSFSFILKEWHVNKNLLPISQWNNLIKILNAVRSSVFIHFIHLRLQKLSKLPLNELFMKMELKINTFLSTVCHPFFFCFFLFFVSQMMKITQNNYNFRGWNIWTIFKNWAKKKIHWIILLLKECSSCVNTWMKKINLHWTLMVGGHFVDIRKNILWMSLRSSFVVRVRMVVLVISYENK